MDTTERLATLRKIELNYIGDFFGDDATGESCFAARTEGDGAHGDGEERMVAPDADVLSRFDPRTALADDYHARTGRSAVGKLHSKIFRV